MHLATRTLYTDPVLFLLAFARKGLSPMSRKSTHVVPAPQGGWNVKQGGADRASGHFDTKQEAIDRARVISNNQGTELMIHNKNGQISHKDSNGHDPFPPKG